MAGTHVLLLISFLPPCVPKMAPLNHQMPQHSPLALPVCLTQIRLRQFDTDRRPRRLLWRFGYQHPLPSALQSHPMLTGGTQKEPERKWHLEFGEDRMAQRDR